MQFFLRGFRLCQMFPVNQEMMQDQMKRHRQKDCRKIKQEGRRS